MGPQTMFIVFLCVALLATRGLSEEVWEFGVDAPGSIVVDHKEGDISMFQRTKEIQLRVPRCYVTEYVRVQVHNSISSPTVAYNKPMNVVLIKYKPLQYSVSRYNVVAKAARKPGCFYS